MDTRCCFIGFSRNNSQNEATDSGAIKKTLTPNTFEGGDCLKVIQ